MGNASYVFYQSGEEEQADPTVPTGRGSGMRVARVDDSGSAANDELWRGLLSAASSAPPSLRNSLEDLHHDCVQQYGGTIMPIYEEGEEPISCSTAEVEPIFDEVASTENEGEEDGPQMQMNESPSGSRGLEDDWFLITASDSHTDESRRLNLLRVSIDGTKRSCTTVKQGIIGVEEQQGLSSSLFGKLNFLGLFAGSKPQRNTNEINFLKDKIDLLSSQVMQVEELRNHITQVTAMLNQLRTASTDTNPAKIPALPLPALQHVPMPVPWHSSNPPVPSSPPTAIPPPPPLPSLSSAPPPPPPPSSTTTTQRTTPTKKQLTIEDLEKKLHELISCGDISAANIPRAVQAYIKCFGDHKDALEALVQRYPFLIKKLALKPKTAYQRMKTWEDNLFATLDEKQAASWRRAKEFEIQKWESKEEILAEINRIRLQIVEKERKEREEIQKKDQKNVMASMMQELERTFKAAQQEQEKRKEEAELEQLEDEPIDLDEDTL